MDPDRGLVSSRTVGLPAAAGPRSYAGEQGVGEVRRDLDGGVGPVAVHLLRRLGQGLRLQREPAGHGGRALQRRHHLGADVDVLRPHRRPAILVGDEHGQPAQVSRRVDHRSDVEQRHQEDKDRRHGDRGHPDGPNAQQLPGADGDGGDPAVFVPRKGLHRVPFCPSTARARARRSSYPRRPGSNREPVGPPAASATARSARHTLGMSSGAKRKQRKSASSASSAKLPPVPAMSATRAGADGTGASVARSPRTTRPRPRRRRPPSLRVGWVGWCCACSGGKGAPPR